MIIDTVEFDSLRYGHRETAGEIIECLLKTGDSNFNHLHKEVLLFNTEDLRPFREISARKKPWDNMQVFASSCWKQFRRTDCAHSCPGVVIAVQLQICYLVQITPIHCAAINPNAKYLSKLLGVLPEYNLLDRQQKRPIHYAAACEGPDPLKFLLQKYVSFQHKVRVVFSRCL